MLLSVLTELAAFLVVVAVVPGLLWLVFDIVIEGEK
jgi:hypothetical protein